MSKTEKAPAKSKSKKVDNSKDWAAPTTNQTLWTYGDGTTPKKIKISSWNVNGIRSVLKKGDLTKFINEEKPDILCLGQTKVDLKAFNQFKIKQSIPKDYFSYWNFCKNASGYSGVAILSRFKAISCKEDLGIPKHDQQGRIITLQFDTFYLITAYIPNSGRGLPRLDYRTRDYLNSLKLKKNVILCGDLNVAHQEIDLARPKGNQKTAGFTKEERVQFTKLLQTGWIDTYRELHPKQQKFSWWSSMGGARAKNIGWRLDYFVINKQLMQRVGQSQIDDHVMGSDHCPISLTLK